MNWSYNQPHLHLNPRGSLNSRSPRSLGEVLRHKNQAPDFSWVDYHSHCQRKIISLVRSYWRGHIYDAPLSLMPTMWQNLYPHFLWPSFHALLMAFSFSCFLLPFVISFDDYTRGHVENVVASWACALNSKYNVFLVQFNVAGITQTPMECQAQCLGQWEYRSEHTMLMPQELELGVRRHGDRVL